MRSLVYILSGLLLLPGAWRARAGGGPENVLVVAQELNRESLELARYYAEQRGIPDRNILAVPANRFLRAVSEADFAVQIYEPITNYLAEAELDAQIDYVVFTWRIPYGVFREGANWNGLTGVMLYGYKDAPDSFVECNLNEDGLNPYYEAETAYSHADARFTNRTFSASILTGWTLEEAKTAR
jgi:uncharacterized protein (TIGR03790 family)